LLTRQTLNPHTQTKNITTTKGLKVKEKTLITLNRNS